jgi:hypothetical protein
LPSSPSPPVLYVCTHIYLTAYRMFTRARRPVCSRKFSELRVASIFDTD